MAFSRRIWELTAAGFVGYFALAWVWRIATMRWGLRGSRYPGRTLLSDRHGAASISEPTAVLSPGILISISAATIHSAIPRLSEKCSKQPGVTLLGVRHEPVHHWVHRICEPDPHHLFRRGGLACL
jgi:hypothetical protein